MARHMTQAPERVERPPAVVGVDERVPRRGLDDLDPAQSFARRAVPVVRRGGQQGHRMAPRHQRARQVQRAEVRAVFTQGTGQTKDAHTP